MIDPYVYPGTSVLKNFKGIRDPDVLRELETDNTYYRLAELNNIHSAGCFSFPGLCQLHHHIFQDLYDWAGRPRIINIEKPEECLGGISIEYADYKNIEKEASLAIETMNGQSWEEMNPDQAADTCTRHMAQLWKVHPFREGNTRTVITFCCRVLESRNLFLDTRMYYENSRYVRTALAAASAEFHDLGDLRQPEHLKRIVKESLARGDTIKKDAVQCIEAAGLLATQKRIKEVIYFDRREGKKHSPQEVKKMLQKKSKKHSR